VMFPLKATLDNGDGNFARFLAPPYIRTLRSRAHPRPASAGTLATCAHGRAGDLKGAKRRLRLLEERDENERVTTLMWKKRSVYLRAGDVSLPRLMRPLSSLYAQVDRRRRKRGEERLSGSCEEKREGKCESSARHNRRNISRSLVFLPRLLAFDKY